MGEETIHARLYDLDSSLTEPVANAVVAQFVSHPKPDNDELWRAVADAQTQAAVQDTFR